MSNLVQSISSADDTDGKRLLRALHKKQIPVSRLDDMARRILTPQIASGQTKEYPRTNFYNRDLADEKHEGGRVLRNEHVDVRGDNPDFARKVAAESTVSVITTSGLIARSKLIAQVAQEYWRPATAGCAQDRYFRLRCRLPLYVIRLRSGSILHDCV